MKKYFVFIALSLFSLSASADSVGLLKGYQSNPNGTTSDQYSIKYTKDLDKTWDVDILFSNIRNRSTSALTDVYEGGLRYKIPVYDRTSVYLRGALGSMQPSGSNSRNYSMAEVGLITKPFNNDLFFRLDTARMFEINTDNMDNQYSKIWLGYDVKKSFSLGVRRDYMRGDLDFDAWQIFANFKY